MLVDQQDSSEVSQNNQRQVINKQPKSIFKKISDNQNALFFTGSLLGLLVTASISQLIKPLMTNNGVTSLQSNLVNHCEQPWMLLNTTIYGALGYDIIIGNPVEVNAFVDPGFKDPIFRMELTEQNTQNNFFVPQGYNLEASDQCAADSETQIFLGSDAYANYLSGIANGSPGDFGSAFVGSSTLNDAQKTFYQDKERISSTRSNCNVYKTTLNTTAMPEPDQPFLMGVRSLMGTYNETAYMKFFESFGTHYQTSTTFGSAYYYTAQWTDTLEMGQSGTLDSWEGDINQSVQDYVLQFKNADQSSSGSSTNYLSQSSQQQSIIIGTPPQGLTQQEWQSHSMYKSMPIQYELQPIYNLFNSEWLTVFANIPQSDLQTIYSNMQTAAAGYTSFLANSGVQIAYYGPAPPDVNFSYGEQLTGIFAGAWSNWMEPFNQDNGVWMFGQQSDYGVVAACVQTDTQSYNCQPDNSSVQNWVTFNLPGPMACIGVQHQSGYGIVDIWLGYWENGVQQLTSRAFDNYNGYPIQYCVDEGDFIVGLQFQAQSGYGLVNVQTYLADLSN